MTPSNGERTHANSERINREIFQCLGDAETPKGALGASIGAHGIFLLVLLLVPLVTPQTLNLNYRAIMLAPPPAPPDITEPPPLKLRRELSPPLPLPVRDERIVETPLPVVPKPITRQPEPRIIEALPAPAPPPIPGPIAALDPKPAPTAAPPRAPVVTNVFPVTASPVITVASSRSTEAAGFGETTATRDVSRSGKAESTGSAGFGDVQGSREAGRPGVAGGSGTLGGFDVGSSGTARHGSSRAPVVAAGFAAPAEIAKPAASASRKAPDAANEKPVEIILKPRPEYTDEARKMRIEGEVLLRVLFSSSGEVRVLDVIRGLGHGLNENAIRAAEQIRFKPAQRSGLPVDSTAIVHLVFQLAY